MMLAVVFSIWPKPYNLVCCLQCPKVFVSCPWSPVMSSTETEKSEPEKPIKVCGRARGKGRGRGRACKRPASASASSRPATQAKVQDGSDVSTSSSSQSEESKRIAAAAASWEDRAAGKRKAPSRPEETMMVEIIHLDVCVFTCFFHT